MALLDIVIDVSHHQGIIDWTEVAAAGIKVAMIKATEGETGKDDKWADNLAGATAAGIVVIPYHFLTDDDPATQANHFNSVARLAPGSAYAIDWEGVGTATPVQVDVIGQALVAVAGRTPLGYWGIPGSTPKRTENSLPENPSPFMQTWERWVPRYRKLEPLPNFGGMGTPPSHSSPFNDATPFLFWQYTSRGRVNGINVNVDRSVASFANADALVAWCKAAARAAG